MRRRRDSAFKSEKYGERSEKFRERTFTYFYRLEGGRRCAHASAVLAAEVRNEIIFRKPRFRSDRRPAIRTGWDWRGHQHRSGAGLFFQHGSENRTGNFTAVLLPPTGLLAFMEYYRAGHVDIKVGAGIVVGLLLGGWLGGDFAQQLPQDTLRKIFAVLLVITAVKMWTEK